MIGKIDITEVHDVCQASTRAQAKILELQTARPLDRSEISQMVYRELVALGDNVQAVDAVLYRSHLNTLSIIDEQRVELIKTRAEIEKLESEKVQEPKRTSLEEKMEKFFVDWEQQKMVTAKRFEELEKKDGIQKTIDEDQLKMAMAKIEKLEKETSNLKDQVTSNFFELQHREKKISEQQREIQELTVALDDSEAELQEQYQKMSILQKDLKDSESSCRELLKSHERVVQDLKDQKEKDDEQIRDLLKIQEGNATRIAELLKRNRLVRSGATSRVQALKDTVAKQDREIESLEEKLANPWK